ncbi:hypothetical protein Ahy_B09g099257 [Arachis hypogaea]|uniref:Uncharacterized protein n=1 Tax=Arachis hypogaea TaxID=3818 RepID=A0A444XTA7_ARAHY|nr:hypothetical protein Ahy_B09g099257 [Arachis hypogaea]
MEIASIGTKGILPVHDFVIPHQEKEASYSQLARKALLIREFARLVGEIIKYKNSKSEKKWPLISRKTQNVVDAVKASIERGFEPISIQE